jgi:hypothetical protein
VGMTAELKTRSRRLFKITVEALISISRNNWSGISNIFCPLMTDDCEIEKPPHP